MVSRHDALHTEQESLFVMNQQTGMIHPRGSLLTADAGNEGPIETAATHDAAIGPHVNVLERNAHLQNMLRHLGVVSRTAGLQIISETGQRSKLEERYDSVDSVVGAAVGKSNREQMAAKRAFAQAFGLEAMIASGLNEAEAKNMAAATYSREVLPVFADAKNAPNRSAAKQWLNHQERMLTGKATRKPKSSLPKSPKVV